MAASAPNNNPVHSLILNLPVLMLVVGLIYYFYSDSRQRGGQMIYAQAQQLNGSYRGISAQGSRPDAQRLLWVQTSTRLRGARLSASQAEYLAELPQGEPLVVGVAPRVAGSTVLWVYRVASAGTVLFDARQAGAVGVD